MVYPRKDSLYDALAKAAPKNNMNVGSESLIKLLQKTAGKDKAKGKKSKTPADFMTPAEARLLEQHLKKSKPKPQKVAPQVVFQPKNRPKPNQGDSLDALFNQLMQSFGSESPSVDYETALAESEQAIRDAYRNDIEAIRMGNRSARKQTAKQRQDLEQMYNALGKDYQKMGARQGKLAENLGNRMEKGARQSANFLKGQSRELLDEQAARAENLGIEDAFAGATEGVMDETQDQMRRVVAGGSRSANRQRGFGGNNRRFMERGSMGARLEGTNRSADLLENLQSFLLQNRQRIAGLKGERGREISANRSSVMSSVAEMEQAADAEMWDRMMGMAGLKLNIDKERNDQSMDLAKLRQSIAKGSGEDDSMPGLSNVKNAQHYLSQLRKPKKGTNVFKQLLQSDEFLTGKQEHSGQMYSLTPYKAAQMVEQMAQEYGLGPRDKELLRLAVMAQMG